MVTIKLRLRPSTAQGKAGRLYYQLTHKRQTRYIMTDYRIFPNEWNQQKKCLIVPTDAQRATYVESAQSHTRWIIRLFEKSIPSLQEDATFDDLYHIFHHLPDYCSVFTFLKRKIDEKKSMQREGTARTYYNAYHRFRQFREDKDIDFDLLTPRLIEQYEAWLRSKGLMQNSIRFYLRTLHTLFIQAEAEGLVDGSALFSRVHLSYVATRKRAISEHELRAIEKLQLPEGTTLALARDIFMFSFYTRGMSFVDIAFLEKKNLQNGVLTYQRRKTNQELRIEWHEAQQRIVDSYAALTKDTPYLLPLIRQTDGTEYAQYQRMLENINRCLHHIGTMIRLKQRLTSYVARHSWASIARNMNIPLALISEGMGHQSYKTTQIYLNTIDSAKIDEANKLIIRKICTNLPK